jgi:hypothetical protein
MIDWTIFIFEYNDGRKVQIRHNVENIQEVYEVWLRRTDIFSAQSFIDHINYRLKKDKFYTGASASIVDVKE